MVFETAAVASFHQCLGETENYRQQNDGVLVLADIK